MALRWCTVDEDRGLCGAAFVPVVQTTEVRHRDDRAVRRCCDGSRRRRILVERQVRSRFQVILDVRGPHGAHKLDDAVMTFVATLRAEDPALSVRALLPRIHARFGLDVHPRSLARLAPVARIDNFGFISVALVVVRHVVEL